MAASTAKRAWNHGSSAGGRPAMSHQPARRSGLVWRATSTAAATSSTAAPGPSGYTVNASSRNGAVRATAAQPNHAAAALAVSANAIRHATAVASADTHASAIPTRRCPPAARTGATSAGTPGRCTE